MQRFSCPHCGLRDEQEFYYATDAGKTRPGRDASDDDWARYRFFRQNKKGVAKELWLHAAGCGRWFVIERDTVTHQVSQTVAL